ncbi:MAG: hypothetical protein QM699_09350 [Amaricoccus sp.]|uniref:hypothetical protein n=1 Tax=Amaricoccus sp. TaxID=1872485 RepID=UPI0039E51CFB
MRHVLALAAVLLLSLPASGADTMTCRPDALGTVSCPADGVRPRPRPIYRAPVQALDRVEAEAAGRSRPDAFVPARETRRLGGTMILERGLSGPCRPDMLGNLNCR